MGLYYLQSCYYNPTKGRFLNADAPLSTGQGVLGNNMFAYCGNNPVSHCDPTGYMTDVLQGFLKKNPAYINLQGNSGSGSGVIIIYPEIFLTDVLFDAIADTREKIIAYVEVATLTETRDQSVYVLKNAAGQIRYVGRTNDPVRREYEHTHDPTHSWRWDYKLVVVATGLTIDEAKFTEQALISAFTIFYLENARREISRLNLDGFKNNADAVIELVGDISMDELLKMMRE